MHVEAVPHMVLPGGSHCVDTFQSKFEAFLLHLYQYCHLSLSAVKGYKTMLNSVVRLKELDLSTDQVLWEVIHTCGQRVWRTIPRLAPGNVDVVLLLLGTLTTVGPVLSPVIKPEDSFPSGSGDSQKSWETISDVCLCFLPG